MKTNYTEELDMSRVRTAHFIGIGGIGMSGIARLMLGLGYRVSGSDARESEITRALAREGAAIRIGHSPRALRSPAGVAAAMLAVAPVALGSTAYLVHWDPVGLMDTTFDRFLVQGSFGTFLLLGLLASGAGKRPTPARASG